MIEIRNNLTCSINMYVINILYGKKAGQVKKLYNDNMI